MKLAIRDRVEPATPEIEEAAPSSTAVEITESDADRLTKD